MELEKYLNKIHLIKSRTIQPGSLCPHHYSKWVSPRPNDWRVDKFIDLPYPNIVFAAVYAKGDPQNGDRFIDLGVSGFPRIIRLPFASLSPNEFRFPSKAVDANMRHVVGELLENVRYLSMGEDTFKFLSGKMIPIMENSSLVETYITSLYTVVRGKIPFRCESCKKFLWVDIAKLPNMPTRAKCPACSQVLMIETPKGLDRNLERYLRSSEEDAPQDGDMLLSVTGEVRPADTGRQYHNMQLDVDLDSILNDLTSSRANPSDAPARPAQAVLRKRKPSDEEMEPPLQPQPEPKAVRKELKLEPPAGGGELDFLDAPAASGAKDGAPKMQLDDDFFNQIMPDTQTVKKELKVASPQAKPLPTLSAGALSGGIDPDIISYGQDIGEERAGRTCHVCGIDVGSEKICPGCQTEQMPEAFSIDDMFARAATSGVEIRLKADPKPETPLPPPLPDGMLGSSEPPPLPPGAAAPVPYWEERIWSIKTVDDVYEGLDMPTIEDWIREGSVLETDLVRKGEAKWAQMGTVPYFRTAFAEVRQSIRLGASAETSFTPAALGKRLTAALIDLGPAGLLAALGFWFFASSGVVLRCLGSYFLAFMYFSLMNGVMGRTLGKMAMHLAVVNIQGQPIGFGRSAYRTFLGTVTFGFGFIRAVSDKSRQAVHDKISGCYVVEVD